MHVIHDLSCLLATAALCLGVSASLHAAPDAPAAGAHDESAQLPPVIVRPEEGGMLEESDRRLRALKRGLPEGQRPQKLDFGSWVWESLGFGSRTIQDAHPADQQRAADLMLRLGEIKPE